MVDERFDNAMDRELLRLNECTKLRRIDQIVAIDRHQPLRQSFTRPDLGRADGARLHKMYDRPADPFLRARLKVLKIVLRLAGVRLLRRAVGGSHVFSAALDSSLAVAAATAARASSGYPRGPVGTEKMNAAQWQLLSRVQGPQWMPLHEVHLGSRDRTSQGDAAAPRLPGGSGVTMRCRRGPVMA